jgi:acyl-CoA thioesterase II
MPDSGLTGLLSLRPERDDEFIGEAPRELLAGRRIFGGALLAIAVRAAALTVAQGRMPHSMHHVFVSPGRSGTPVRLRVSGGHDGRTFSTRRVDVLQDGVLRGMATLSFAAAEAGADVPMPMRADAPSPQSPFLRHPVLARLTIAAPFDLREVDLQALDLRGTHPAGGAGAPGFEAGPHATTRLFWARLTEPLSADRLPCVLAYLSDFGATIAARAAVGAQLARSAGRYRQST